MTKTKTIYTCQVCGYQSPKWIGRCPQCNHWNTMVEEISPRQTGTKTVKLSSKDMPKSITKVDVTKEERRKSDIEEFDRILGGGLVNASVVLIGGPPGIGKSTLLLQMASQYCKMGSEVLYVSAEESIKQSKMRANRLNANFKNLYIVNQTDLNIIKQYLEQLKPDVAIVDSIQAVYKPELNSIPGNISQVKECAGELTNLAKNQGFSLFLIGHITKEGTIAGPRVLEHVVDTVLYFEGDSHHNYRLLRAVKNRFGSTNEVGIFEMTGKGLIEVKDPSDIFLSERPEDTSGSVVVPILEGSRPILVELQALVTYSGYSQPTRRTTGFDYNKVNLLIAVLEKRIKLKLSNKDIFINVAGGVRISEPAADLAVAVAIASSLKNIPISKEVVVFGEVGLGGEIRAVSQALKRIKEAKRLGFKKCIVPLGNTKGLNMANLGIEVKPISDLYSALKEVMSE